MKNIIVRIIRLTPLMLIIGAVSASSTFLFLLSLDYISILRLNNPWLIIGIPVFGLIIYFINQNYKVESRGIPLITASIFNKDIKVPLKIVPYVFISTLLSHLGGASVGREGVAIQLSSSLNGRLINYFQLSEKEMIFLKKSFIASGFSAIFGTPIAGFIFSLELFKFKNIKGYYPFLILILIPSIFSNFLMILMFKYLGSIHHLKLPHLSINLWKYTSWNLIVMAIILAFSLGFIGKFHHLVLYFIKKILSLIKVYQWIPILLVSVLIIGIFQISGSQELLGLGIIDLEKFFYDLNPSRTIYLVLGKLLLTTLCIGVGFKGGEATPLFFIGAGVGAFFNHYCGFENYILPACGFIALFGSLVKTPIAAIIIGVELFGISGLPFYALVCFLSNGFNREKSIYL